MKSFLTRLTSGIVLVFLVVVTCWYGGLLLGLFTALIGWIGLDEFYRAFGMRVTRGIGLVGLLGAFLWNAAVLATDRKSVV